MLLLVDNGSAYTDELDLQLRSAGCTYVRLEPRSIDPDSLPGYTSFVLSGRRTGDRVSNKINARIISNALARTVPLLGICYGAEMIALSCGGAIRRMARARRGAHTVTVTRPDDIFSGTISVFESHMFEISTLPKTAVAIASSAECANEIIHIRGTAIYGTQFHPEMSDDGSRIVSGFARRYLVADSA